MIVLTGLSGAQGAYQPAKACTWQFCLLLSVCRREGVALGWDVSPTVAALVRGTMAQGWAVWGVLLTRQRALLDCCRRCFFAASGCTPHSYSMSCDIAASALTALVVGDHPKDPVILRTLFG